VFEECVELLGLMTVRHWRHPLACASGTQLLNCPMQRDPFGALTFSQNGSDLSGCELARRF
jgi:hypothetical protein